MDDKGDYSVITLDGLQCLLDVLTERGYEVVGPRVRDQAIVYEELSRIEDLPSGWTDEQDGGHYRLKQRADNALFGYAVGPHSWKRFLHPPRVSLWQATINEDQLHFAPVRDDPPRYAFLGVRACELAAIAIQDRVLMGDNADPHYRSRREQAFLVALNCSEAGGTCFCDSMNTGPDVKSGYDLVLTELLGEESHGFLIQSGSEEGAAILAELPKEPATEAHLAAARGVVERTRRNMGRSMPQTAIPALLMDNLEHPRWDDVAERCLSCSNCTMVCPTCFCTTVEDTSDLEGVTAESSRRWDSCFNADFSYIHGGSVRNSTRSRYRQWMTHKLATWVEQFGTSGCVGCGRCVTWCPVGIDITEEVRAIQGDIPPGEQT
ncbi:4Fe-4S dicluster domain-containing protein [Marinobacter sediminum]|uniref:4Fe-4S dicluster domain-containing protein n=1 Tax=Marinobacter sediminum TaxID=256323 RepID=UPI00202E158F|nr:4Fe-4S dicluster domain-containing protein [Marinobacter sediminum]MCM0612938.1 4Fe-4S dicluster domain-containing protein [Marinobacter sediminum]